MDNYDEKKLLKKDFLSLFHSLTHTLNDDDDDDDGYLFTKPRVSSLLQQWTLEFCARVGGVKCICQSKLIAVV